MYDNYEPRGAGYDTLTGLFILALVAWLTYKWYKRKHKSSK